MWRFAKWKQTAPTWNGMKVNDRHFWFFWHYKMHLSITTTHSCSLFSSVAIISRNKCCLPIHICVRRQLTTSDHSLLKDKKSVLFHRIRDSLRTLCWHRLRRVHRHYHISTYIQNDRDIATFGLFENILRQAAITILTIYATIKQGRCHNEQRTKTTKMKLHAILTTSDF